MLAHNKSAIAYQDRSRCRRRLLIHKRKPHQQPGLLPSCTNGAPGAGEACQQQQVHLLLDQTASKVLYTGVGSYLTQSYSVSQAYFASGPGHNYHVPEE
jgi:hypothetical protein